MTPTIAVIGAGMGGLTAAAALRSIGCAAPVFEQAPSFARVGAGIQLSANALRAIEPFGAVPALRAIANPPSGIRNHRWDTDELLSEVPVGEEYEARYGAPYLLLHRGDLHATLATMVAPETIQLGKRLRDLHRRADGIELVFEDGSTFRADGVVGADGIHSRVHDILFDTQAAHYSGHVAYRAVFPASLVPAPIGDKVTKWWGDDRHIVIYAITRGEEVYVVAIVPEAEQTGESWSQMGDTEVLRKAFEGFPEMVQTVLKACPAASRLGINVRDPLPRWSDGPVVLLGDACHPMTPYMAQGAAMAMEDAVVLARCLEGGAPLDVAFRQFERTRLDRTSLVQAGSAANPVLGTEDLGWLYGYDAWTTALAAEI
jgi:6-hydroxynicotinate 3-monooxygenase